MIVRYLEEIENGERTVEGNTWKSRRLLLRDDGLGFSLHDTLIYAGTSTHMQYSHHIEAVYCIAGSGRVRAVASGEEYPVTAGTLYALDRHDEHILLADTEMRMICVFNPPLRGDETHDENGAYPPAKDDLR